FFPTLDHVALHELRFFASAPGAPPVDDTSDGQHSITWLSPGVPAFTVESTHHEYRLTKEFVSDSEENAMIISGTFTPELPDVRLFMQASAHWSPGTEGNYGEVLDTHPPALLMREQDVWICIVGPFSRATTGYYRSSDIHVELHDADGFITQTYDRAGPGNVAVGAELGVRSGAFQLAIGFAHSRADAEEVARQVLQKGAGALKTSFARAWHATPDLPSALAKVSGDDGSPHWTSTELDQVALPILLAWRLGVAGCLDHDPYPTMVRPAAQFIIREGPLTQLDRWEDLGGLSPSTLATCIAALIAASEFAQDVGEHVAAAHLRAVADYWNDRVEAWCSTVGGQYLRLAADPDRRPAEGSIAPEFLELVR